MGVMNSGREVLIVQYTQDTLGSSIHRVDAMGVALIQLIQPRNSAIQEHL